MKSIKGLFFILLVLTFVFCAGQAAFALIGSQAGDAGGITVFPKAKGTQYDGPLTIYYTNIDIGTDDNGFPTPIADMNIFLRLQGKKTLDAFSGQAFKVAFTNIVKQQEAITSFINITVIPLLYPDYTPSLNFLLKSVDLMVQDDGVDAGVTGACCNGMLFTIMDVVIAVQD